MTISHGTRSPQVSVPGGAHHGSFGIEILIFWPNGPWLSPARRGDQGRWGVHLAEAGNVQPAMAEAGPVPGRSQVQVVPLRGLPIVAAVVVFVIASIAGNWLWALTFCHVARYSSPPHAAS